MITYRNPLWNTIIQFLKELKDYPPFQDSTNGRIKSTVEDVYNRACKNAKITVNDWKVILLNRVLPYLMEKDIEADASEVFKHIEETNFDKFCLTSKDGFELFDSAKKELEEIKNKKNKQIEYEKTYQDYMSKKEAHDKYIAEQEKTRKELEEAEKKLQEAQNKLQPVAEEIKEQQVINEDLNTNNKKQKTKTTGAN